MTVSAHRLLVDGKLIDGVRTMDVINPATGIAFAQCPVADKGLLDEAVASATRCEGSRRC